MTHDQKLSLENLATKKHKRHKILFFLSFIFVFFVLFCGRFPVALAAETQVSISLSDNLAFIGDRILVKVIVKTTADADRITVEPPVRKDFEILLENPTRKRKQQDYTVLEKDLEIAFFKTGEFYVGPFRTGLNKNDKVIETRETNSVPVTVKSVLKEEDKDIKPLKDPVEIRGNPKYIIRYVLLALAVVVLIVLLILWIKKRKKKAVKEEEPLLSPLEELELKIKELYRMNLFEKGKVKLFFLDLTQIIKQFLHRTYGFNAEDFTTYETFYELKRRETEAVLLNNMEFLFNTADLVKFAKFIPDAAVLEEVSGKLEHTIGIYKKRAALLAQENMETQEQPRVQEQEKAS
jgi:hypothetical protein